ncbi:MAG: Y-family DNA polymerase [Rubinisphaera brasiliensis]|uniref:Y-family DNA polymerase n=1 Tax=Rubinisphaera brasiliensis TaxID=119 RepID=UPI0039197CB8
MRRFVCLWLPRWPLQRFLQAWQGRKAAPFILYEESSRSAQIVAQVSAPLLKHGVAPGMSLTDARALLGRNHFEAAPLEPAKDLWALRKLAIACQQFSPIVSVEESDAPDSLLFDITGCIHLFGDEQNFCRQVLEFLEQQGYRGRIAIADTLGLAWGMAHCQTSSRRRYRITSGLELRGLPVEALRLPESILERLREFDLSYVEQVLRLARNTLRPRFGSELPQRLDQLTGQITELLIPETLPEPVCVREQFDEGTTDRRRIEFYVEQMLDQLLELLNPRQHGLLRLNLTCRQCGGRTQEIIVGMIRPLSEAGELRRLIGLKMEHIHFDLEVKSLELLAAETAPLRYRQSTLFVEDNWLEERERDSLINRLSIRLGEKKVLRASLVEDVQPERSVRYAPALNVSHDWSRSPICRELPLRPATLFTEPVQVRVNSVIPAGPPLRFWWDQQEFLTEIVWGPERIETGWWRDDAIRRDYYRVETTSRQRFWIFRRRDQRDWYLHGCFD